MAVSNVMPLVRCAAPGSRGYRAPIGARTKTGMIGQKSPSGRRNRAVWRFSVVCPARMVISPKAVYGQLPGHRGAGIDLSFVRVVDHTPSADKRYSVAGGVTTRSSLPGFRTRIQPSTKR